MIHIYVPLEPNSKDRERMTDYVTDKEILDARPTFTISNKYKYERFGAASANSLGSNIVLSVFATSAPRACGVGQIAPSLVDSTTLVLILGIAWGDLCTAKLPRAMERNRPDHVLAFVRGWGNEVHERNLRGYLQTKYSVPLKVIHIDED